MFQPWIEPKVERDACFVIRSLDKKKIPTKDMCLGKSAANPQETSHFHT
jgi:hypothetical protein